MAKLLSFLPSPQRLARSLALLGSILFFALGCCWQRVAHAVETAAIAQPVLTPVTSPSVPKIVGSIILDNPIETPIHASYKGSAAQEALPAAVNPAISPNVIARAASGMALDSNHIAYGGDVMGTIALPANGDTLRLLWIDEAGRVLAGQDYAPANGLPGGSFTFKMPQGTFGHLHKIALVRIPPNGGNVKVEAVSPLRIDEAMYWGDYIVLSASDTARKLFPSNAVRLESLLLQDENPLFLKTWATQADAFAKSRETKLLERQPALFDEKTIDTAKSAVETNLAKRIGGISLFSMGDGADLSNKSLPFDYDRSPETLELFRDWLASRYGSLSVLNKQWHTNFSSWDKVVPPTTDDAKCAINPIYKKRMTILKDGDKDKTLERRGDEPAFFLAPKELHSLGGENLSGWADFRAFNDYAFARILREFHAFAKEKDRNAQVGFINAQPPSAWGGWDYQNVVNSTDWIEEHSSIVAREIMRGMAPKMHFFSAVNGQEAASTHRLWDRWLRGDDGCIVPTGDGVTIPTDDIAEMTRGITMLRNSAQAQTDPIAIYYSPRSIYLHWMFDSEIQGSTWLRRDGREDAVHGTINLQFKSWLLLLEDLGYAPYFIHPEDVTSGKLHYPDTKVVILPKVLSLSQTEASALRDFVNEGGCLIADGQCGTFDGMGKRRTPQGAAIKSPGTMDADFGIVRSDFIAQERGGEFKGDANGSRVTLRGKDNKPVGAESPELRILEPNISAAGGIAHASCAGSCKAMITKAAGKGRYFYLNLCLQDYALLRGDKTAPGFHYNSMTEEQYAGKFGAPTGGEALRLAVSDILDEFVGENPLSVSWGAPSTPARGLKRTRFDLGNGVAFYSIMPLADAGGNEAAEIKGAPLDATTPAIVSDGKPHCWYDMRSGEYLGSSDAVTAKIEPNRPALLAALPYTVEKISLKVRRIDQSRTFKIGADLVVAGALPGRHVYHVEVFDPAGKPMPYYATNIATENGSCTHVITLGVNEPAGTYHVKFRDALTGKSAEGDLLKDGQQYNALDLDPAKQ